MKNLSNVSLPKNWNKAIATGFDAFDELLGNCGGINGARAGKLILLSAQSGTGKTRLCITLGNAICQQNDDVRYGHFTAEQSVIALAIMGKTMGIDFNDRMLAESEHYWPTIKQHILKENLKVVVLDSFPMITFPNDQETKKPLDTKQKVKEIADFADENSISIIMLNHTDKKGNRAGRNELMHLVDVAYTMWMINDGKKYDGMKVVEFRTDKNREGVPVNRAFPFNGTWELSIPMELEDSKGNESGVGNNDKIAARKAEQRQNLIDNLKANGGTVLKEDIDSEKFGVTGMIKSSIISLLRELTEEKIVKDVRKKLNNGRGKPSIVSYSLVESV